LNQRVDVSLVVYKKRDQVVFIHFADQYTDAQSLIYWSYHFYPLTKRSHISTPL